MYVVLYTACLLNTANPLADVVYLYQVLIYVLEAGGSFLLQLPWIALMTTDLAWTMIGGGGGGGNKAIELLMSIF